MSRAAANRWSMDGTCGDPPVRQICAACGSPKGYADLRGAACGPLPQDVSCSVQPVRWELQDGRRNAAKAPEKGAGSACVRSPHILRRPVRRPCCRSCRNGRQHPLSFMLCLPDGRQAAFVLCRFRASARARSCRHPWLCSVGKCVLGLTFCHSPGG